MPDNGPEAVHRASLSVTPLAKSVQSSVDTATTKMHGLLQVGVVGIRFKK